MSDAHSSARSSDVTPDHNPRALSVVLGVVAVLLASGIYLWAVRGQAILMDLAGGIANMLCL